MTEPTPTILLTRPARQSEEFATALRAAIGDQTPILVSPILEIVTLPVSADPENYDFVVLTSAHGCAALAGQDGWAGKPAWCVGDRTARAAAAIGLDARSAGGTAEDLARLLAADRPKGRGLYLRGRHVASDLSEQLNSAEIVTDSTVTYDQRSLPLSAEAAALLAGKVPVILPVFSPRSARLLSEAVGRPVAPIRVIAMSPQVAQEWKGAGQIRAVASEPTAQSMIAAIDDCLRGRSAC